MNRLSAFREDYLTPTCFRTTITCAASLVIITALVIGILALMEHGSFALLSNPGLCGGGCLAIAGLIGICILLCLAAKKNKNEILISVSNVDSSKKDCLGGIKEFLKVSDLELRKASDFAGDTKDYEESLKIMRLEQFVNNSTYLGTTNGWAVNIPVKIDGTRSILILLAYHDEQKAYWRVMLKQQNEIVAFTGVGYLEYSENNSKKEKTQEKQLGLIRDILEYKKCSFTSPLDSKTWRMEPFIND